jgi:hypothetical protein
MLKGGTGMRIATAGLILAVLSNSSYANGCNEAIAANCSCVVRVLENALGARDTTFLFSIWSASRERDEDHRHRFFAHHVHEINATVLKYFEVKSLVGFQCGSLNLDSDGLD